MLSIEHYQKAADILDNNMFIDDSHHFKISYEYCGKYFTITMRYFIQDDVLFGFIHFDELSGNLDEDSSYLVGYIIATYVYRCFNSRLCELIFYTDKNVEDEFHNTPTFSFCPMRYRNSLQTYVSEKYKFYKVYRSGTYPNNMPISQLIEYMDNKL